MSIPVSNIVSVDIAVSPTAVPYAGFGGLLFLTDETSTGDFDINERVRKYGDLAGVQEDFASDSEVVAAAMAYYGQTPTPKDFYVGLVSTTETAAQLNGASGLDLSLLQAVEAGGFDITVDGQLDSISAIDLSLSADLDAVATAIDSALTLASCEYDAGSDRFIIKSLTTGASSSITFATNDADDLASVMGILATDGGSIQESVVPETPSAAIAECYDNDNSFYGVAIHRQWRDGSECTDVSAWVQATGLVHFVTSNDARVKVGDENSYPMQMKDAAYGRVITMYSSTPEQYPSCSLAGRAFTVNFEGTNTTITLFLKQMPGVTAEKLSTTEKANLENANCNAVMIIGGNSVYSDSRMADGKWFDTVHGTDWLQNRIETDVFNLLYQTTTKVPYTDVGVSMIMQRVTQALEQGVTNGLIAPGNNANGEFLVNGYRVTYIPTAESAAADKSNRIYRGISFEAVGSGAIQNAVINGTFTG